MWEIFGVDQSLETGLSKNPLKKYEDRVNKYEDRKPCESELDLDESG